MTPSSPLEIPYNPDTALIELRAIRRQLNVSQAHFATLLGVDVMTVSRYERGLSGVPKMALALARTFLERPQEPLPPAQPLPRFARDRHVRTRRVVLWDVAFVLVRMLPEDARCWHGRDPATDEEKAPCAGQRMQFVVLLPPTPHVDRRRTETITCEQHAYEALFWLKKHHAKWYRKVFPRPRQNWGARWIETRQRLGESSEKESIPELRKPGRPRKSTPTPEETPV